MQSILIGIGFLVTLKLVVWPWLEGPSSELHGSLLAAYAIVFTALGSYRVFLGERERGVAAAGVRPPLHGAIQQLSLAGFGTGLVLALLYAPQERTMGQIQRIFHVHVPSAWIAFFAFFIVFVASVVYLKGRSRDADLIAASAAEVGVVFTSLVLITGPIWAKPAWGIWWTWDARLTLTLILWLVYVGYLMLRAYILEPTRRATLAAVVGILGFVGVPINYMAIRWWRTQHPAPVIAGGEGSGLDPMMARTFWWMLATFTLMFFALFLQRLTVARLERMREEDIDERLAGVA